MRLGHKLILAFVVVASAVVVILLLRQLDLGGARVVLPVLFVATLAVTLLDYAHHRRKR
jgi:hypothetical protein